MRADEVLQVHAAAAPGEEVGSIADVVTMARSLRSRLLNGDGDQQDRHLLYTVGTVESVEH